MSQQLPGMVKIVLKLPRESWAKLQRFRGGSDSDRINRILDAANDRMDAMIAEKKAEIAQGRIAKDKAEKPGLLARWFKAEAK